MREGKEHFLGGAEVAAELGVSERTLGRWVMRGRFPRPVKYGSRRHWTRGIVDAWIAAVRKEAANG